MKLKRLVALLLAISMVCCVFASCSKKLDGTPADKAETTEIQKVEVTDTTITVSDRDGNVLKLIPLYDKSGAKVIAGYVESGKDSNNADLTKESYKYFNQVIAIEYDENNKPIIKYNANGNIIVLIGLLDDQGSMIAVQDALDLDGDGDIAEYFRVLTQHTSDEQIYFIMEMGEDGNLVNVTVEEKEDGTQVVTTNDGQHIATSHTGTASITPAPAQKENVITLHSNSLATSTAKSGVSIQKGLITITEPKELTITSDTKSSWIGQIVVSLPNTSEGCELRFENVDITNNKGNIIQILDSSITTKRDFLEAETAITDALDDAIDQIVDSAKAPDVALVFPTGTASYIRTTANSYTGAIYNESKLTIKGNGALNVISSKNTDNCICSTKSITIKNSTINLSTAANTATDKISGTIGSAKGIFSYAKVTIESGNINIKTNGDAIRCESFYFKGGTANITSSACDAIDSDDLISVTGGYLNAVALEKSAYKVRRVNNTVNGYLDRKQQVRLDGDGNIRDYFLIDAGTVIGESKKMTQPTIADQPNILAKVKVPNATGPEGPNSTSDSNRRQIITIKNSSGVTVKASANKCTKFLYSHSSLSDSELYTGVGDSYSTPATIKWDDDFGVIKIKSVN